MNIIKSIRYATISDVEQVAELFNLYRCFYKQDDDIEVAKNFITERLQQKNSVIIVAETIDGKLAGFVQMYPLFCSIAVKNAWVLNDLFIHQDFRKFGIATQLIEKSLEIGKNSGAAWVSLQTAIDNYNAQKLYEKVGFVKDNHYLTYMFDCLN